MKAVVCHDSNLFIGDTWPAKERKVLGSAEQFEQSLLSEIRRLGGEERANGVHGALEAFQSTLAEMVRQNPRRYGATEDTVSQRRIVSQLLDSMRTSFLQQTLDELRRQAGYIRACGYWVHRAVFTFVGFGFLLAALLPFCAVSVLSTAAWGWLPGVLGLVSAVVLGIWILSRIKSK